MLMEKNHPQKLNQDFLSFVISVPAYFVFLLILGLVLYRVHGSLPTSIGVLDAFIVLFATLRLTNLLVYDKVMQFVRDIFDTKNTGVRRTIFDLLSCPWCTSMWMGAVVLFLFYLHPYFWLLLATLAVSGVATIFELLAKLISR